MLNSCMMHMHGVDFFGVAFHVFGREEINLYLFFLPQPLLMNVVAIPVLPDRPVLPIL